MTQTRKIKFTKRKAITKRKVLIGGSALPAAPITNNITYSVSIRRIKGNTATSIAHHQQQKIDRLNDAYTKLNNIVPVDKQDTLNAFHTAMLKDNRAEFEEAYKELFEIIKTLVDPTTSTVLDTSRMINNNIELVINEWYIKYYKIHKPTDIVDMQHYLNIILSLFSIMSKLENSSTHIQYIIDYILFCINITGTVYIKTINDYSKILKDYKTNNAQDFTSLVLSCYNDLIEAINHLKTSKFFAQLPTTQTNINIDDIKTKIETFLNLTYSNVNDADLTTYKEELQKIHDRIFNQYFTTNVYPYDIAFLYLMLKNLNKYIHPYNVYAINMQEFITTSTAKLKISIAVALTDIGPKIDLEIKDKIDKNFV